MTTKPRIFLIHLPLVIASSIQHGREATGSCYATHKATSARLRFLHMLLSETTLPR
ncbi:hypothetical protein JRQ81_006804 [Phrynocephalus forsythii]|uniref:Uncharacterized protein n=1 Tax=Phrynocephalus forsythii TaxID=171643 RepID=A0A9Q1AUB6_9SAUR|nr:hypothetical protein JRQ81_006804 [Phrynocephalus forsythii]